MTQQYDPPTPWHLHYSQNFDKVDILHQIFRSSGGVNIWGTIHRSKRWYSLEPSQKSKVDFFAEIAAVSRQLFL